MVSYFILSALSLIDLNLPGHFIVIMSVTLHTLHNVSLGLILFGGLVRTFIKYQFIIQLENENSTFIDKSPVLFMNSYEKLH